MKNLDFITTNMAHYKSMCGKLAFMLEEAEAWPISSIDGDVKGSTTLSQGSVVMILDITIESPPATYDGSLLGEKNYLHWITFEATFHYKVLVEDKILKFVGKKMSLIPKIND